MKAIAPSVVRPTLYPDSDGKPMSDNTLQFQWIMTIQGGLDAEFRDDPGVFVAGNLLWYAAEGHPEIRIGPDVMVVLGRPKGHRGSYQQWLEEDIPPQVVFEVLSPGNRAGEQERKLAFYQRHGVEEYYRYDPDNHELSGWLRSENGLQAIAQLDGWVSPRLGIRFDMSGPELQIFGRSGRRFATYLELAAQRDQAERQAEQAERQSREAVERAERLAAKLRELGVDPEA